MLELGRSFRPSRSKGCSRTQCWSSPQTTGEAGHQSSEIEMTANPHRSGLSNWPLRGAKEEVYEGGVRGVAFVHSPLSVRSGEVEEGLVYITDWVTTILSAAKIKVPQHLDSENLWPLLSEGGNSPRSEIILSLDQVKI